jgi:hypothetical protein
VEPIEPIEPTVEALDVEVTGVQHTHPESILRLMDTRVGEPLREAVLINDLARLRATGVLYDTEIFRTPTATGVRLRLRVKDKWTLLPFLTFRRGGARTTTAIGAFDTNLLGRLLLVSAEATSNADIPFYPQSSADRIGHLIELGAPRALGSPVSLFFLWQRSFIDFGSWDAHEVPGLVFDRARHLFRLEASADWRQLTVTVAAQTYADAFALNSLSPHDGAVPPSGRATSAIVKAELGVIEENLSRFQGTQVTLVGEVARAGWLGSNLGYVTGTAAVKSFFVPRPGHNVGLFAMAGATTGQTDSTLFRLGGLSEVRGFRDSYFAGQQVLRTNVEYRVEVHEGDWPLRTITQVASFVDAARIDGRGRAVAGLDYEGMILGAGSGIRVNLVPFAHSVGRIDLALGLYPFQHFDLAVGVQQFF